MNQFLGGIQMGFGLADTAARRKLAEEDALAMRDYRKQMGQYYDEQAESNRLIRQAQADKLARESVQEMERQQWIGQKWQELNPEGLETGAVSPDVLQSRFDRIIMEGIGTGRLPANDYMPYIRSRVESSASQLRDVSRFGQQDELAKLRNELGVGRLAETERHNKAMEDLAKENVELRNQSTPEAKAEAARKDIEKRRIDRDFATLEAAKALKNSGATWAKVDSFGQVREVSWTNFGKKSLDDIIKEFEAKTASGSSPKTIGGKKVISYK